MILRNPARGKRRRLKQRKPERTFLDRAEQIVALLDAAGELDAEARVDRRAMPRRAVLTTFALAGLRIGEGLALRWRDVDLAAKRIRVVDAKTDAGVRQVNLLPALKEQLADHRARTRFDGLTTSSSRPRPALNRSATTSVAASSFGPSSGRTQTCSRKAARRCRRG